MKSSTKVLRREGDLNKGHEKSSVLPRPFVGYRDIPQIFVRGGNQGPFQRVWAGVGMGVRGEVVKGACVTL